VYLARNTRLCIKTMFSNAHNCALLHYNVAIAALRSVGCTIITVDKLNWSFVNMF